MISFVLCLSSLFMSAFSAPFSNAFVSIETDDGRPSVMTNLIPMLQQRNLKSTHFLNSNEQRLSYSSYMSETDLRRLANEPLVELQSHTEGHKNLVDLCSTDKQELIYQVKHSHDFVKSIGGDGTQLAAPFGAIDDCVIQEVQQLPYVKGLRGTYRKINYPNTSIWRTHAFNADQNRSVQSLKNEVDNTIATRGWMQIYWHLILEDCGTETYCFTNAQTEEILDYIQQKRDAGDIDDVYVSEAMAQMDEQPVSPPSSPPPNQTCDCCSMC